MPTGTKQGSMQQIVNCGGISGNQNINVVGSSNPSYAITAPAGLPGTIGTNAAGSCTIPLNDPTQTVTTGTKLAIFWVVGGVLQACYDLAVASVSFSTPTNTATITQSAGVPTSGVFWAASGSAPTALPANGFLVTGAINTDLTQALEGVTIPGGTGANILQLMATSTQPGIVEWLKASGSTQERLSVFTTAGAFDTWPTAASQLGSLPTGGNGANWTSNDTVTVIRFYNLGSTIANVGVSSQSAVMQAGAILA